MNIRAVLGDELADGTETTSALVSNNWCNDIMCQNPCFVFSNTSPSTI